MRSGLVRMSRLLLSVALLSAAACAAKTPAVPVASLDAVAGKWEGVVYTRNGNFATVITIDRKGTYEAIVNGRSFPGVLAVDAGKLRATGATTGRSGVWTLHEADGRKTLVMESDDGMTSGEARLVK